MGYYKYVNSTSWEVEERAELIARASSEAAFETLRCFVIETKGKGAYYKLIGDMMSRLSLYRDSCDGTDDDFRDVILDEYLNKTGEDVLFRLISVNIAIDSF